MPELFTVPQELQNVKSLGIRRSDGSKMTESEKQTMKLIAKINCRPQPSINFGTDFEHFCSTRNN